mmetsp:Transcript_53110/g.63964  ORF Transcript_53110/g.63964 Transcript_53110/m.63964 type:complete len:168 (-) Transcript_53110:116-619(-)
MESISRIDLDDHWLTQLQTEFRSARIDDDTMLQTIIDVKKNLGYLCDPHTAVAFAAAKELGYPIFDTNATTSPAVTKSATAPPNPVAIMATASPCKFEEVITLAIGKQGWMDYFDSDECPINAKTLMQQKERDPTVYRWKEGMELEDVQKEWEDQARGIINTLFERD